MREQQQSVVAKRLLILFAWALAVLVFSSQWYAYDAGHGFSEPFVFYLGWSCYLWGILTPLAVWLAWRHPIHSTTWTHAVPFHVLVSVFLTSIQLSAEAYIAWFHLGEQDSLKAMVAHYLRQHLQIGLVTYWFLLAATHFYRIHDQARKRQLQAAQLEARLAEAQIENLRTQLHPHFLFNTLQAAVTLIHEDPDGAEEVLLRLSELLRVSLDEMHTHEISLAREIQLVEHYMGIQQRRFGDRLRFELEINPAVTSCAVPTLVLQPLVENAVRHGIAKSREREVVSVRASQHEHQLYLEVANLTSTLDDSPERLFRRGVGLSNTRARLQQLYGSNQSLSLLNKQPRGVCVRLSIPIRELPADQPVSATVATA